MTLMGLMVLVLGIALIAFSIQLFMHDKDEFAHNHDITESVSNAITGQLNLDRSPFPERMSRGFYRDIRTNRLVPCSQISREGISD